MLLVSAHWLYLMWELRVGNVVRIVAEQLFHHTCRHESLKRAPCTLIDHRIKQAREEINSVTCQIAVLCQDRKQERDAPRVVDGSSSLSVIGGGIERRETDVSRIGHTCVHCDGDVVHGTPVADRCQDKAHRAKTHGPPATIPAPCTDELKDKWYYRSS